MLNDNSSTHKVDVDLTCKGRVLMYVRVSTKEQNEDRQLAIARDLGIPERNIYIDKASGKNFDRPRYQALRNDAVSEGDLVLVESLDRFGRNYDEIKKEWQYLTKDLGADILVLDSQGQFDSRKFKNMPNGLGKVMEDMFLTVMAYLAEQERKKNLRRQRQGIDEALKKGVRFGRPRVDLDTLSKNQIEILVLNFESWKKELITGVHFMGLLGLKKNSFYKVVKQYEELLDKYNDGKHKATVRDVNSWINIRKG